MIPEGVLATVFALAAAEFVLAPASLGIVVGLMFGPAPRPKGRGCRLGEPDGRRLPPPPMKQDETGGALRRGSRKRNIPHWVLS